MINHLCPTCELEIESPNSLAGQRRHCPACATLIDVPADAVTTDAPAESPDLVGELGGEIVGVGPHSPALAASDASLWTCPTIACRSPRQFNFVRLDSQRLAVGRLADDELRPATAMMNRGEHPATVSVIPLERITYAVQYDTFLEVNYTDELDFPKWIRIEEFAPGLHGPRSSDLLQLLRRHLVGEWTIKDAEREDSVHALRGPRFWWGEIGPLVALGAILVFFGFVMLDVSKGQAKVGGRGAALALLLAYIGPDGTWVVVILAGAVYMACAYFVIRRHLRPRGRVLKRSATSPRPGK